MSIYDRNRFGGIIGNHELNSFRRRGQLPYNQPTIDLGSVFNQAVTNLQTNLRNLGENLRRNWEEYQRNEQLRMQQNNSTISLPSLSKQLSKKSDRDSLIHEELADKEKRIRQLEIKDHEKEQRILELEKQVEEFKTEKGILGWFRRAIDDSKKERIFG